MTARLPRIPVGKHRVWSEPHRIQPDSLQRDFVSRQRDKAHRLGGGFFPLTGAAVGWMIFSFWRFQLLTFLVLTFNVFS
ncbi:MAG: hypothetical protein WCI45_05425 [Desulfuromonadales bacterium]